MSEFKDTWYVWDVNKDSIPEGYIYTAIDEEGNTLWWTSGEIKTHMKEVKLGMHAGYVVAYTKGEKRRRCVNCNGKGFTLLGHTSAGGITMSSKHKCRVCNGTGWEYKA